MAVQEVATSLNSNIEDMNRDQLLRLLYDEARAQASWTEDFDEAVASRVGLSRTDQRCLEMILQSQLGLQPYALTPGELARQCHLTRGAVTGVLDRLEAASLVVREHDTRDRRRVFVRPTQEAMSERFEPVMRWLERSIGDVCEGYSDEQLELLIDFSRRFQAHLQIGAERLRRHAIPG